MRSIQFMAISAALLPLVCLTAFGGTQRNGASPKKGAKKAVVKTVAANAVASAPVSFREDIEPFLKANCGSCHSADKHNSGFVVETPTALFAGGQKHGKSVIVPGNANGSAIVLYLRGKFTPRMPRSGAAADPAQIAKLEAWINQGAKVDAVKLGWPYTPPVAVAPPKVKNAAWAKNPIDAFVLAKLEAKGLKPRPARPENRAVAPRLRRSGRRKPDAG